MKLENKEIALVIKPFPTYLLIQSNNHEQKLPYNDITNTFIHYVNINKIPPQLQENFQNLRVQIIKSETENYIVDLKSQNEHELNLDPSVDVYHKEKVKHYNDTKFDFIKFKKKEHKKKMINIINEVRNKNYESSITVFEGRNKKCQRFMVLCKGVGSNVESSFDMTSKFVKSLKELKKGGGSNEFGINSLKNSLELNGSSNSIVGPGSGFSLLDTELYGNFNSLSKDKQILLTKKIHAKENMHYLTVFVIAAERPYCVVRYGDKVNTHNKGYIIKHIIPKNIGEYFENIKSNYAHLGFVVKNEAGQNLKSTKRFHVNDISSRIHESPNLEAPKKSDSYEQNVYIHSRPSPKNTNNMQSNKTFVASQPGYNQIDPQIVNKKQQQVNPQNNYQVTPNLRINQNKNQKSNDSSQNSRQSIDSFNSKDMNTEMAYNSTRPMQNKPMHKPYMPEYQGMNPMMQQYPPQSYSHKQQGFPNQRHTTIAQQTARGRHIYAQPPQIYRQPTPHQSPIMPQNGNMINYPSNYGNNVYNLKPNYSVNPSVLYEDPRAKTNPSHINNINMKQQTPEKEEKSTKQRKDEAQDMPDFF